MRLNNIQCQIVTFRDLFNNSCDVNLFNNSCDVNCISNTQLPSLINLRIQRIM